MKKEKKLSKALSRRSFMGYFSSIGLSSSLLPGVLWAKTNEIQIEEEELIEITIEMVKVASEVAGLQFSDDELEMMVQGLNGNLKKYDEIRNVHVDNSVAPPLYFNPVVPGTKIERVIGSISLSKGPKLSRPANLEDVAFWPLTHLAHLIETRQVKPSELTSMYLARLKKHNPTLNCVVNLTESRALEQARRADEEIKVGKYRGPLHGIPWGAKDIISAKGYKTTWGAAAFKDQEFDIDATVVERLDEAGAILVAKLTTGELAFGDQWFGGRTNNPWNTNVGSGGSSAGSGSATAAGLVGFAIGTDTGGSMLSPLSRCGLVGIRPTFGRVSRYGVMAAGFSLDKIGPMCRSAEDCAIVLHAIAGPDGQDMAVNNNVPFSWDGNQDIKEIRVGYFSDAFDKTDKRVSQEEMVNAKKTLEELRSMGVSLKPVTVPQNNLTFFIEYIERAAGFEEFVRSGNDATIKNTRHRQDQRVFKLTPAVDYLRANRIRMLLMQEYHNAMKDIDVLVAPWRSVNDLTSMTGHPVASVPNGFTSEGRDWNGQITDSSSPIPTGIAFVGQVYGEEKVLTLAKELLEKNQFFQKSPKL